MKFAKELEDDAVPEWRVKYLNYKGGKKKIKAVSRALRALNKTPATPARPDLIPANSPERLPFTHYDFTNPSTRPETALTVQSDPNVAPDRGDGLPAAVTRRVSLTLFARSPPILIPGTESAEQSSRTSPENIPIRNQEHALDRRPRNYGSIIGTPPTYDTPGPMAALELPDPALTPVKSRKEMDTGNTSTQEPIQLPESAQTPDSPDPYHVGDQKRPQNASGSLAKAMFKRRQDQKDDKPSRSFPGSRLRRMFTSQNLEAPSVTDVQLSAYRDLDQKQAEFFQFLDSELEKIESFYRFKEEEATARLQVLRNQLHEMRDRRMEDIQQARNRKGANGPDERGILEGILPATALPGAPIKETTHPNGNGVQLRHSIGGLVGKGSNIGETTKAMVQQSSPLGIKAQQRLFNEANKDYVRRRTGSDDVPYRFAKRRLKLALQEFYRGLELLKSYTLLNRTGFRKINKKYDKAVQARPPLRYMAEKVNSAYFVKSDVIDGHIVAVEDLYARYFERGNHKIAVGKLRSKLNSGDQSATTFRNGLYLAAGTCLGIAGLVNAGIKLFDEDPVQATHTSYLLQIYGGYFLALLLFLIFALDCRVWSRAHVNYAFVFEYDTRTILDWRQLAELPCFFLFLNGLFVYLNFRVDATDEFYRYWPILLIAITLFILALPFRILYYSSRRWWAYSNWRLFFAGLYPVEFRDFFLGDMYCSQTYAMGQIELFFCLYANEWNNPPQCNSSHSRLLGFFASLPAVWRALQCLRRYYDSRNWFPHLANFAKYCCNIMYYMTLSIYRIDMTAQNRAFFIAFACINGIYCSFWDVAMDFSLGNPWAKHPFLRDQLAYKRVWTYYAAIVSDILLRQQWIFYAIFTGNVQHSTLVSFLVSLAEVIRRGVWSLFRVENEHCNNVGQFRASRDIPLPYHLPDSPDVQRTPRPTEPETPLSERLTPYSSTGADLENAPSADSTVRRRRQPSTPTTPGLRALQRVGTVIASAHAQDFEKKRRTDITGKDNENEALIADVSSDEDDDDDDDDDEHDGMEESHTMMGGLRMRERERERNWGNAGNADQRVQPSSDGVNRSTDRPPL